MNKEIERQLNIIPARTINLVSRDELRKRIQNALKTKTPLRVKYGADPSAPDIHLGHVVVLNKLREFQELGAVIIFIIGDFTALIGDPSGQSQIRKPLSPETIRVNAQTYQEQVFHILDPQKTEIRFNSEWFSSLSCENMLKLCANATIAQMLARDDFQKRFTEKQAISLAELLYPIIQGYDSVMIKADIELGGTDQLFNLLIGRDIQKAFSQKPQTIMTLPLLKGLDGKRKMSKSLNNYVGISEPPREMFGKLMSIPDSLIWDYYSLVLAKSNAEVKALRLAVETNKKHPRDVKDAIAQEIVSRFHSSQLAASASEEFKRIFSAHKYPDTIPTVTIPMSERKNGKLWIASLLVTAGLAKSRGAARRLIQQGAVRIGEKKISDAQAELEIPDGSIIQVGKRGFARIVSS